MAVDDPNSDDVFDPLPDQTVSATTTDDDAAGFTVTESAGTTQVSEAGTTDTFDVVLDAQPVTDVVFTVQSNDTGEATVNFASLTFTNANWSTPQTVTVTGINDGTLVDGNQSSTITIAVDDVNSDNAWDPLADQTVSATTTDDDVAGYSVTQSGGTTSVDESGTTDTFDVVLTAQPLTDVEFNVSSADVTEATVNFASLTFTNANWNVAQTVTVTGVNDAPPTVDGSATTLLTVSVNDPTSDDAWDPLADETFNATTTDDDTAGFTVTESGGSTTVDESGTTDTFDVVLTARPLTNVVFDVSSADVTEATVSTSSLTFTPGNWNTVQTVTVTGVDDPTPLVDGAATTLITVSVDDPNSDDAWDPLADVTFNATTTDNDAAGFSITQTGGTTQVSENGTTDTFDVVLTARPQSDVQLLVSSGDVTEATVSAASLTFTNANWNVAQTVTVTGVDDATPLVDGTASTTITVSVDDPNSDDAWDPLADQTFNASTTDNDVAGFSFTETAGSTIVDEDGSTDTFDVVLTARPLTNVEIDVSAGSPGEATAAPTSLTFTNANWNVAQTVTVTGIDDTPLVDGDQASTITLIVDDVNSDNAWDPLPNQTVNVTTTDTDVAGFTVTESGGTTSATEGGATDDFTVVLDAQPTSNVVFDVSSDDTSDGTVSPTQLTFTMSNWNTPQSVTFTAVDDPTVDGNGSRTLTVTVNDGLSYDAFDPLADQTVSATTVDDDVAGFTVTETGGNTMVSETGTTDTFDVVLDARPLTNVQFTVVSGDTGEATVSAATLLFTPGNWNSAQTVTVTGVNDGSLVDGDQNTTITIAVDDPNSDDAFDPLADQTVSATTTDDDAAGFSITETGGNTTVDESGTTDTFDVVLTGQPNSAVVITVTSGDVTEATVSAAPLTFTNANWNVAQTITVTGVNDTPPTVDGSAVTTVTLAIDDPSSDDAFDPLADQTVSVTTTDDDAAGFSLTETGGTTVVSENGATDTFDVVLTARPLTDVVFGLSSTNSAEATAGPTTMTFTNANWDTPQTVTVTGVDDATPLVDGNGTADIIVTVNDALSDDAWDPLPDQSVTATNTDNDVAGFSVTETGGNTTVDETGTTDTFDVVLDARPVTDVVFTVTSGDTGEATVSASSLTFTNANWDTPQTITMTGVNDGSLVDGNQNTTITVSVDDPSSDDAFDPLADQTVSVTTTDDDVAGFSLTETGGTTVVSEDATIDSIDVVLTAQPLTDVVLGLSSTNSAEATAGPITVTFTNANWDTPQTVTVTGVDDATPLVDGNGTADIIVTVNDALSDDAWDPLPDQSATATNTDNDVAGFSVTETGGNTTVDESGTTDTFDVVLDARPLTDVVINVTSGDVTEATADTTLTFTNANWDTPQTVTVTGVNDTPPTVDGSQVTTITISIDDPSSDDAFDPLADQTVNATTTDDDVASIVIMETGGNTEVDETGSTDVIDIALGARPLTNVVLTITSSDTGEATVSQATATFTPTNWANEQTITITGQFDGIVDGNQVITVTISVDDPNSDDAWDPLADEVVNVTVIDIP